MCYPNGYRGQADMIGVTDFLNDRGFPKTTRRTYADVLRAVLTHFEGRDLAAITRADFMELAALRAWMPATTRLAHMAMRSFLRYLGADAALAFNWRVARPGNDPQRTLMPEDKAKLLQACRSTASGKQLAIIVEVLWGTWMRASELCGARLDHLDLQRGILTIQGKGGKWRDVPLTMHVASLLEAWIRTDRANIAGAADCPTVFVTSSGQSWTRESLRTMLRRLGDRAGVPVSPHDFRRGACTDAIRKGMNTITAQRAGGWSSPLMVDRYARGLTTDDVRAALERVA